MSRETYPAAWEGILSGEQHGPLVDALTHTPGARRQVKRHLLSGIATCGLCGGSLKTMGFNMKNGQPFPRYQCVKQPGSVNCGKVAASKVALDRLIKVRLFDFLAGAELVPAGEDASDRARSLELEIAMDRESLVELTRDRYVRRTVDAASFEAAKADLDARMAENEGALAAVARQQEEARAALPPAGKDELEAWWAAATVDEQRAAIRHAFEAVRVNPAKRRGGNVFDGSRVETVPRTDLYQQMVDSMDAEWTAEDRAAAIAEDAEAQEAWEAED